ncbi:MAG: hypothetical protein KGY60_09200 [Bacteroidales bacterium]|nr:hypothetical protein [Bacteroidales bacterium]
MRFAYKAAAYLLVFLGIVHIALTPLFFKQFGLDVLWFAGTGLGLVFLGNLNLVVMLSRRSGFHMMAITSNMMALLLMILILSMNPSPQAWIGFGLLVLLILTSVNDYVKMIRQSVRQNNEIRRQENDCGNDPSGQGKDTPDQ